MMKVKEYLIFVNHPETGSSSSYGSDDLMDCLKWALDWAGVEFRVEGRFEDG